MQAQAKKKYIGISNRKLSRLTRECVRKRTAHVKPRLAFLPQKAARVLLDIIKSAEANFLLRSPNADTDMLLIKEFQVGAARGLRRLMYRARGRADRIHKRASHIHVVVTDEPIKNDFKNTLKLRSLLIARGRGELSKQQANAAKLSAVKMNTETKQKSSATNEVVARAEAVQG